MNFDFELKCAGGLPGRFAGTFAGCYICLERLIVVDSSSCYLDIAEFTLVSAGAERQNRLFKCAVHTLCSTSDTPLAVALWKHHPNQCARNAINMRRVNSEF